MKLRKTKNTIVIGTAHLGVDYQVLKTIKSGADYHKAKVVHVGPLATKDEIAMWRRREKKLRTWENGKVQKAKNKESKMYDEYDLIQDEIEELYAELEDTETEKEEAKVRKKIDKLEARSEEIISDATLLWEKMEDDYERLVSERQELEKIQWARIELIRDVFGDGVEFVCNDELMLPNVPRSALDSLGLEPRFIEIEGSEGGVDIEVPYTVEEVLGKKFNNEFKHLGKYLQVTAVPANGDKMSGQPITPKTFRTLRKLGGSHIIPHPITHTKPFPRPGINQAYNYMTTGSLKISDNPKRNSDAHKSVARTGCILVSVDEKSGEFHAQRLRIKTLWGKKNHKEIPHIIHDGIVINTSGVIEVDSEDKLSHTTDVHAPYEHMGFIAAVRALQILHYPHYHCDGGDMVDMESVSRHTKNKPGAREGLRLINDINSLVRVQEAIASPKDFPWIKERDMLESNHADWLDNFIDENPELKGLCDWATLAKTKLQQWNVWLRQGGADRSYKFGDLDIKHADREPTVAKASDTYGNYLGGHHHRYEEWGDAIFTGPGCRLGPKYLQNNATSWQTQATSVTKYKGKTCAHPKTILYGKDSDVARFAYRGQIYEVPFYKYKS